MGTAPNTVEAAHHQNSAALTDEADDISLVGRMKDEHETIYALAADGASVSVTEDPALAAARVSNVSNPPQALPPQAVPAATPVPAAAVAQGQVPLQTPAGQILPNPTPNPAQVMPQVRVAPPARVSGQSQAPQPMVQPPFDQTNMYLAAGMPHPGMGMPPPGAPLLGPNGLPLTDPMTGMPLMAPHAPFAGVQTAGMPLMAPYAPPPGAYPGMPGAPPMFQPSMFPGMPGAPPMGFPGMPPPLGHPGMPGHPGHPGMPGAPFGAPSA